MPKLIANAMIDDVVTEAIQLSLCFMTDPGHARHVPFALTPAVFSAELINRLAFVAPLLGRLTQVIAKQSELLQTLHAPLAPGDAFFAELLSMHRELSQADSELPCVPLLLQRSDFMLDAQRGAGLVECNSIAAGMSPFGARTHTLHRYVAQRWPQEIRQYNESVESVMLPNPAIEQLGQAVASAARKIRLEHADDGAPVFLMVVQEREDNVFDQHLLERDLQERGVLTLRKTFRQLHGALTTGPNQRLMLDGLGIDVVYLRAGYQYQDYLATDLDSKRCCDALRATRIAIERHRVAVNATVAQQLATSKRTQQHLAGMSAEQLAELGFTVQEVAALQGVFTEMRAIDDTTIDWMRSEASAADWVLKNQGEGGGHCLFDDDIQPRIARLAADEYPAWGLMRRLRPVGRSAPTLVVREGVGRRVEALVSELGMFSAHYDDEPLASAEGLPPGYVGYLVRSKPPEVTEGGVHSGFGMLDSIAVTK